MKLQHWGAGLALTLMMVGTGVARADDRDNYYRDRRPGVYRDNGYDRNDRSGRYDSERERRDTLRDRTRSLIDLVQSERRRGRLSDRDARRLRDRIDRVEDQVRHVRTVDKDEYRRWMGDLDRIDKDLRHDTVDRRDYDRRDYDRRDDSRRDDYRYRR